MTSNGQHGKPPGIRYARRRSPRSSCTSALESVGQALNLGRTAGALKSPGGAPTFAMRSEQLDANSCPRCEEIHGSIVQADTPDYYALLPPSLCLGGGRCRGVMVFADGVPDVRAPH